MHSTGKKKEKQTYQFEPPQKHQPPQCRAYAWLWCGYAERCVRVAFGMMALREWGKQ